MLQTIVSIIAFVIAGAIALLCGVTTLAQIFIAGLLGVILVNLLLCAYDIKTEVVDLRKEVAELKSKLEADNDKTV